MVASQVGTLTQINEMDYVNIQGIKKKEIKAQLGQKLQLPENFSHRLGYIIVYEKTYLEVVLKLQEVANVSIFQIQN